MRSLLKTTAIATLILYAGAGGGGAYAASHHDHDSGDQHVVASSQPQSNQGQDHFVDENPGYPANMMVVVAPHRGVVERPRLTHVLGELRAEDHRIDRDRTHGKLSATAFNRLEREESNIRAQAVNTADRHGGTIPNLTYAQLQNEIRQLDRDVARSS
ncbi:hypothetical protein J2Y48_000143 [Mycoplana sp. BE70]|uniref:hypothetical protein n=1 Tax=Mycoplana sp. BE70 TaxID=2817775 RepID=UPI002858E198|nr:hypothetical protein [Mycoplana sp. BE70]MDR6754870.1 hypothetical protein [Mycoplana sp. BE70]